MLADSATWSQDRTKQPWLLLVTTQAPAKRGRKRAADEVNVAELVRQQKALGPARKWRRTW